MLIPVEEVERLLKGETTSLVPKREDGAPAGARRSGSTREAVRAGAPRKSNALARPGLTKTYEENTDVAFREGSGPRPARPRVS